MQENNNNGVIVVIVVLTLALIGVGMYFFFKKNDMPVDVQEDVSAVQEERESVATPTPVSADVATLDRQATEVLGKSAGGTDITAYYFGEAEGREILIIGGIHGGYAPNTTTLANEFIAYLEDFNVAGVRVTVIPLLNPDGAKKVGTAGRFNTNNVDLNRNFACDWKASGVWRETEVSGGAAAFSEPEARAVQNYIKLNKPSLVIGYYAAGAGVYSSNCHDGVLPETTAATNMYAKASGYTANVSFDYYTLTGDMMNWLAAEKIPAISVLLTNYTDSEWVKNKKGFDAIITMLRGDRCRDLPPGEEYEASRCADLPY